MKVKVVWGVLYPIDSREVRDAGVFIFIVSPVKHITLGQDMSWNKLANKGSKKVNFILLIISEFI